MTYEIVDLTPNKTPANVLANQKRYTAANREKHREAVRRSATKSDKVVKRRYARESVSKFRLYALMLHGGRCERCGNNDSRVLQLDHINGGGTAHNRKVKPLGVAKAALRTPELFQVLCANCNWIKRFDNNENKKRKEAA